MIKDLTVPYFCNLNGKKLKVYCLFERRNETLVEVAEGPSIGEVFYTASTNIEPYGNPEQ